jgi:hypothetical protein
MPQITVPAVGDPTISFQDPIVEIEIPDSFAGDVGVREGSKFYTMGEVYIVVCEDPKLGWTLSMSGRRGFPAMADVRTVVEKLIPKDVKMAMILPDWDSKDYTLNFYEYLGETAPETVNYDRKDNGNEGND